MINPMTITLICKDLQEANQILRLLSECPYKQVADVIQRFERQIRDQLDVPPDGSNSDPTQPST